MSGKKLTQTTLSFFIKSKPTNVTPKAVSPFTSKKRQRTTQDSKCDTPVVKNKKTSDDGNISEPEVTSSSEPVTNPPTATTSSDNQRTLEPFIKLTRCDTPTSIEVSSSTSVDEDVDVPVDSPLCDAVDTSVLTADDSKAAEHDNNLHSENETEDTSKMDTSTEHAKSVTKSTIKNMSLSAKKRREEQRILMEERRKLREEEREKKRLQKLEEKRQKEKEAEEARRLKNEQKEAERLAKQLEKEAKQKAKEALQAQKQAEIDAKNALKLAEKQRKEEERMKKEEEKKQKEAERLREEEKKQKALDAQRNVLMKFFQKPVKKDEEVEVVSVKRSRFKAFCPNTDMKVAPRSRVPPINTDEFDNAVFTTPLNEHQYLSELKAKGARTSPSTWPWNSDDDDVTLVTSGERYRVKLLQFHTDVRPAYFGTWRKKSTFISARRPFSEDKQRFDYDNDSADEWEEEEPGESVDSDDEEEEKDEFDFDPELREDGFLVDHNYLSDGEGGVSDNEETLAAKKTKQMIARTYGKRNRKKNKLKTIIHGTIWQDEQVAGQEEHHGQMLNRFTAIVFENVPIEFDAVTKESPKIADANSSAKKLPQPVPEEAFPHLIKSIHGCTKGIRNIISTVQDLWKAETSVLLSKKSLKQSIQSMACYEKRSVYKKSCWFVKDEFLTKYGLLDLPIPNPAYKVKTPQKSGTLTPVLKSSPSVTPVQAGTNSGQKRLTDFVQPTKKKLKVESVGTPTGASSTPILPLDIAPKATAKRVELVTLSDSPTREVLSASVKNPSHNNVMEISPKRAPSTSTPIAPGVGTPTSKTNVQPRRVTLTTVVSSPKSQAVSPRRIQLITLSTPTAGGATSSSVTSPTTGGSVEKITTPTSSTQSNKRSPRRVQLTTLSKPQTASKPVALLERSQNTLKLEDGCVIIKAVAK